MMATRVVAIISTFNEEDIIGQVIDDLLRQRVSVYVLDNWSTDRTLDQVSRFVGHGVLNVEQFPHEAGIRAERYEWHQILERKAQLAQELDADWFIHHDADEFREGPWEGLDLAGSIERVDRSGYNAIDFELLNFWPTRDLGPGEDVRRAFTHYEPGEPWNRLQIRCWKKTAQAVDLASTGGHEAIFPGRTIFPLRFILRHYPIRGQAHGRRKVFKERRPRLLESERSQGWHIQYRQFEDGRSFLRAPGELIAYDSERVRLDLSIRNRRTEELEASPETQTRLEQQARRYDAHLEQQLDRRNLENQRLQLELDILNRRLVALEASNDSQNHRLIDLEAQLDAAQRRAIGVEAELDQRNRAFQEVERDLEAASERLVALEGRLDTQTKRGVDLEAQLDAAQRRAIGVEADLDQRNRAFQELERNLEAASERLVALEGRLDAQTKRGVDLEAQFDTAQRRAIRVEADLDQRNRAFQELERNLDAANHRLIALEGTLDAQTKHSIDLEARLDAAQRQAIGFEADLDQRNRAFQEVQQALEAANHRLEEHADEMRTRDQHAQALQVELAHKSDQLSSLTAAFEAMRSSWVRRLRALFTGR